MSPTMQVEIQEWAVDRMWKWTRERFGPCEVTVGDEDHCWCCLFGHQPVGCGCRELQGIILPGPIYEPLEITMDGEVIDLSSFEVQDYNRLVRIDGIAFSRRDWSITYLRGEPVPPGGGIVAGILACEYAKRLCNDDGCRLPKRLTVANRQGLTIAAIDNFENLKDGFTGIWEIDDWIAAQNYVQHESIVFSPDVPRYPRVTWSYASS